MMTLERNRKENAPPHYPGSRRENTRTRNVTNKGALQHEGIQA